MVGGTDVEGDWRLDPDPTVADAIRARATALVPELADADVLAHRVGLRPARPQVRLTARRALGGGRVVHCYGHGGAGVTVAWGCAEQVAGLVEQEEEAG